MKALIIIAILMLLGAVFAHFPYGYYQVMRWVVCIACGLEAVNDNSKRRGWYIGIAILFNPIAPFHFERETWQAIDLLAAIALIILGSKFTLTAHTPKTK